MCIGAQYRTTGRNVHWGCIERDGFFQNSEFHEFLLIDIEEQSTSLAELAGDGYRND